MRRKGEGGRERRRKGEEEGGEGERKGGREGVREGGEGGG